ncbi:MULTISPECIES: cation:proton antiporter [Sphingomonadales]|uniref:Cation:proton antiporter n=3 Tax=Sphingomonadaceae TaxID=41297 RepID=A0A2S8B029_9SPHN|nr:MULTISPECIES: cation:proton antiporter [Sphingomonadaceae]AGH51641.1 putative Na+/ H+ antiporter [Sphingomonas sp. MM-1]KEY99740.1 sodium:proton antiporter [Sphingomonas sp. BHC-A]KMS61924.1 sodium:proton antiporter [Sphingobium baderi LL03]PQM25720.1 cation:proton antiporter [Sphingopyxis lindanitolerans]BAI98850.1 putative Na+/ H+ antiporter [Sphingobium indicum UT26S]
MIISVIALACAGSAIAAILARWMPRALLPALVLEIAFGILIGPNGMALLAPGPAMEMLAKLGFGVLMLIAGLEIDLGMLLARGQKAKQASPLMLAVMMSLMTVVMAAFGAWLLLDSSTPLLHLAIYAVILSTTSVGIVVPTIQERRLADGAYGQTILSTALLADFFTMIAISSLAGIVVSGRAEGALGSLALVGIAGLAIWLLPKLLARVPAAQLDSRTSLPLVRLSLALLFMVAWLAERLESELVLAAFLAGLLLGQIIPRNSHRRETLEAIGYGFIVPFFFINVGLKFDIPALFASPKALLLVPGFVAVAFANKIIPALLLVPAHGRKMAVAAGLLLSARLSLIVAASDIATRIGVLDTATNAAMVLVAIISAALAPLLFNILVDRKAPILANAEA